MLSGLTFQFPYLVIFLLLLLGGVGLPFPEDATLITTGFLISTDVVSAYYALPVAYAGLLLADFIIYSAGKRWGRKIVTHRRFQKILPPDRLEKFEAAFERQGVFFVLFGRHFIGFRVQVFLVSGIMRMSAAKFVLADAVSALFTIAFMAGAGYLGGNSVMALKNDITRIEHIAVVVAAVVVIPAYLLYRYFSNRKRFE